MKTKFIGFLLLTCLIIFFINTQAYTIYIIQSETNEMYDSMIYSFKERADFDFVSFNLDGKKGAAKDILKLIGTNNPDAILLIGLEAIKDIGPSVSTIPVIISMVSGVPQEVKNKSNVCGVLFDANDADIVGFIKSSFPKLKTLGIIFNMQNSLDHAKTFREKAIEKGLSVELGNIKSFEELIPTLKLFKASGVDAIWLGKDKMLLSKTGFDAFLKATKDEGIPIIAPYTTFTQKGAAFSVSPSIANHGFIAGNLAIRLSNGETPSEIGIVKTTKLSLSYNKNMMKLFSLEVLESVLMGAKEY